jgi:hypothetical protein
MQHLTQQHPTQWRAYDALTSPSENEEFFMAVRVPFTATLDAHCESSGVLRFNINKSTVESIIGGLLFHPDDVEGLTHARVLSIFRPNAPEYGDPANPNNPPREEYIVEIKTAKRFSLLIGCVALIAYFRMAFRMVQLLRNESGLGVYGGCSELIASNYTWFACAVALQILSEALEHVSGFSIAFGFVDAAWNVVSGSTN